MLVPYTYHSRLGRETMSTDRFLRRATCHHQMLFQRCFKLTLFSKQTSFLKMMSMNTLKFIHWLRIVLAKDLLINSDQEVVHQKWFSSTYLQTWLTEGREVAEDRTSWPAQQVTKDTYLRMHSFHQARRCYHRFQTHFLLSLSISDSVSHLLSCQKKKKKKKEIHSVTLQFNTRSSLLSSSCVCVKRFQTQTNSNDHHSPITPSLSFSKRALQVRGSPRCDLRVVTQKWLVAQHASHDEKNIFENLFQTKG